MRPGFLGMRRGSGGVGGGGELCVPSSAGVLCFALPKERLVRDCCSNLNLCERFGNKAPKSGKSAQAAGPCRD